MASKKCAICERDIKENSPKFDETMRRAEYVISEGIVSREEAYSKFAKLNQPVPLEAEKIAHEYCKEFIDFLNGPGMDLTVVNQRLAGYKAGKPFAAYMNPPYGKESAAVNSYRVLTSAMSILGGFEDYWIGGNILPGECFQPHPSNRVLLVQDLNMEEAALTWWYADVAQSTLCQAVILWYDAHKSKQRRQDDIDMFLERDMYDDTLRPQVDHFIEKRNKTIGHITQINWDSYNTNESYQQYPEWVEDWKPFKKLLGQSVELCLKEIGHSAAHPRTGNRGGDPIRPGVDLINAIGIPIDRGTPPRAPMQDPYEFQYDGEYWREVRKEI